MVRKRPMTTEELFDIICKILKEKGRLPDILDYGLATHSPVPITNYEYGLRNKLDYGEMKESIWICGLNIPQMKRDAQIILALSRL